jgi:pimeloyl-ACP methyl ester carboxylesterase
VTSPPDNQIDDPADLFAVHRALPIAGSVDRPLMFGHGGLVAVDPSGLQKPTPVLLPEGYDEAVSLNGFLIAMRWDSEKGEIVSLAFRDDALIKVDSYELAPLPIGLDFDLVGSATTACAVLLFDVDEVLPTFVRVSPAGLLDVEAGSPFSRRGQEPILYIDERFVLTESDDGPDGMTLNLRDRRLNSSERFRGGDWGADGTSIFCQQTSSTGHSVEIRGAEDPETLALPGPLTGFGGSAGDPILGVFVGDDDVVYRIRAERSGHRLERLTLPVGKKTLGAGVSLVSVQGYDGRVTVIDARKAPRSGSTRVFERPPLLINRTEIDDPGTVIHFHGGPESFEVPEPRMFNLPSFAARTGWDWIGVNYPGSLAPSHSWTQRAWHSWRRETVTAFEEALSSARGPVVLSGWSFGAALALALANRSSRIVGILIGGSLGSIRAHAQRAFELDPRHGQWFSERFLLDGDDGDFLNGTDGFNPDVSVLEIHGADDLNCPLDLIDRTAEEWARCGNGWTRMVLPGAQHYATTVEDAIVISRTTRDFLQSIKR